MSEIRKSKVAKYLNITRQAVSYRMTVLGITGDKVSESQLELIRNFKPNYAGRRVTHSKKEALVWEYYTKTKNNQIQQVAKDLGLSVGYVGSVISKIQKRKYILLPSKMNEL